MKIDITQVHTLISTCNKPENVIRFNQVMQQLETLGFSTVSLVAGPIMRPYQLGANLNAKNILNNTALPFIFMEDDATVILKNYYPVLEIPDDTDVLYLGGAVHANKLVLETENLIYNKAYGFARSRLAYTEVNSDFVRIYNMYCTHAVLFVSEKGREIFLRQITMLPNLPFDVTFSYAMEDLNVYMVRHPFFYQNDGHNEIFTTKVIYDHPLDTIVELLHPYYEDKARS